MTTASAPSRSSTERAIPAAMLDLFLELLRSMHGPNLLRMKAIVNIEETPDRPMVLHGVQHVLHPASAARAWPDDDRRTRMVFIVRDIEPRIIRELFDAFLGYAAPDRPDASGAGRQSAGSVRRAGPLSDAIVNHPLETHPRLFDGRLQRPSEPGMGFFRQLKGDFVFLRGALRALRMTTHIAKNPARIFPNVIEELAEQARRQAGAAVATRDFQLSQPVRALQPLFALGAGRENLPRARPSAC